MNINEPYWFKDVPNQTEHMSRISNVLDIKQYLLRYHKIKNRKNFKFKEETYTRVTSKTQ
jgi:hypothetical protein